MKKLTQILFLILLLSALRYPLSAVYAEVPHLLNYQGRLTDSSGIPLNGSYAITFRLYDAETAGNLLWEETHTGALIQKGIFSVLLGSVTALNLTFDKPYFLEIKVGTEVMSPRQRITSAGYAIRAEHGVPKGVIVMWSGRIADIPSGWALCDGTNNTPDLRDRFIVGARQDDMGVARTNIAETLTQSGGSVTISEANLPTHTHGAGTLSVAPESAHTHPLGLNSGDFTDPGYSGFQDFPVSFNPRTSGPGSPHTHTLSGSTGAVGSGTPYTPPYYALAYIMKL